MFASFSRLDLSIIVGPQKPSHINMILSSPLPILIEYKCLNTKITGRAIWRMRPALRHRDRVREISFEGSNAGFKKFFRATKCSFPVLESLSLFFENDYKQEILHSQGARTIYDVLVWTAFPSRPCPDFRCPQRLSPTSC